MAQHRKIQSQFPTAATPKKARVNSFETVCKRSIQGEQAFFPQGEYHGQTVYFCTEACQQVFLSDPERFILAHSKERVE